jgi:hypothetical protein
MMLKNIKPVVRQVDFALDWTTLTAGNRLYRQGEEASTVYLILSGRLRSVLEVCASPRVLGVRGSWTRSCLSHLLILPMHPRHL